MGRKRLPEKTKLIFLIENGLKMGANKEVLRLKNGYR